MKKVFLISATVLFAFVFSASAQKEPTKQSYAQPISYNSSFNKIVVEDGIDLVLTEGTSKELGVKGSRRNTEKMEYRIEDGTLYLGSRAGSLKNYVRVEIPVQNLRQLTINGDSWVKSKGNLNSVSLKIFVNGEAMVNVTNLGQISIQNSKDIELDIRKSSSGVLFERVTSK